MTVEGWGTMQVRTHYIFEQIKHNRMLVLADVCARWAPFYFSMFLCILHFLLLLSLSFSPSHLWCHKVGGVTGGEEETISSPKLLSESKVTDPYRVRIPRVIHIQDVTGLQVSVYHLWRWRRKHSVKVILHFTGTSLCTCTDVFPHPLTVEVVNSLGDGVEHSTGLSLREKLLPEELIKQLSTLHQLRHQVNIPALVIHLTHSHQHKDNLSVFTNVLSRKAHRKMLLTSFRVMMLGCCPYRIRISISSEGSLLLLSIICGRWKHRQR